MSAQVFWTVFPFWLKAFLFTLAVEVPLFALIGRAFRDPERPTPVWRLLLAGGVGTCVTHPCLWFVWPHVVQDYTWYIVTGELLVACVETCTFFLVARPIRFRYAALAAWVANGASFGFGLLLW